MNELQFIVLCRVINPALTVAEIRDALKRASDELDAPVVPVAEAVPTIDHAAVNDYIARRVATDPDYRFVPYAEQYQDFSRNAD